MHAQQEQFTFVYRLPDFGVIAAPFDGTENEARAAARRIYDTTGAVEVWSGACVARELTGYLAWFINPQQAPLTMARQLQ